MIPPFSKPFTAPFVKPFGPEVVGEFSPLDIPGLEAWYDAADQSTISGEAGSVQDWLDKSGNGNDVAAPTVGERPISGTQTINGLNTIAFDGSNENLQNALMTITASFTLAFVFRVTQTNAIADSIFSMNANGAPNEDFQIDANDGSGGYFALMDSNFGGSVQSPDDLINTDVAIMYRMDALNAPNGVAEFYNSNVLKDTLSNYQGVINTSQDMRIGINRGNNQSPVHHTGEIVIVNAAISDADRTSLFDYFLAKWGV